MTLIKRILHLRILQINRFAYTIGYLYLTVALILFVLTTVIPTFGISKSTINQLNFVPVLILLWLTHSIRKDKRFLQIVILKEYLVFLWEYGILMLPLLISLIIKGHIILLIPSLSLIIYLSFFQKKLSLIFGQYVPNVNLGINNLNYEWISGLKRNLVIIFLISTLCFYLLIFENIRFVPIVYFLFIYMIISKFYIEFEPYNILCNRGENSEKILKKTFHLHYKTFCVVVFPIVSLQLLYFHTWTDIAIIFWLLTSSIIYIMLLIVTKYAVYKSNERFALNSLISSLYGVMSLIPIFLPILLFILFNQYKKSKINLNNYL